MEYVTIIVAILTVDTEVLYSLWAPGRMGGEARGRGGEGEGRGGEGRDTSIRGLITLPPRTPTSQGRA